MQAKKAESRAMTILEAVKKAGEDGQFKRSWWSRWYHPGGPLSYEDLLATDWEAKPKKRRWKLHLTNRGSLGHVITDLPCLCNLSGYETVSVVEED